MNTQNSDISEVQKLIQDEELIDQSFEQINKEISKALLEMKEENQKEIKKEKNFDENIFSNKPEIIHNDDHYNKNNIITRNIFDHLNSCKNNNNYDENIFPNNQFYRFDNNINNNMNNKINIINNNMTLTNSNNNNYTDKNVISNKNPINNIFLNSQYNINIINYNSINKNNNINENNNNKSFNSNKIVSFFFFPGLTNLEYSKNIINLVNILQFKDNRTTLIIRNIPNKYDISLLLKELNKNFVNKFDVIYLPFDNKNNSNLGFGFINFVSPIHIILFFDEFMGKKWNWSNSKKRCCLAYSNYQGTKDLVEYIFKKLGIKDLTNNNINEKIKKSFFINSTKNLKAPLEIPLKYYRYFEKNYPICLCKKKDDKVFIFDV